MQPRARVLAQDYEMVGIESVRPHPKNPRQGDVGAISESIEANGFYGAIVVQRSTGYVLAGNHRLMAARAKGLSEVPCVWVDVDDERAVKILLADNRTNDLASYNDSVLAELLADLANTSDLTGTGYDGDDLDALIAEMARCGPEQEVPDAKIDQAAELQKKWGTELGQLWIIGNHRLLCGDSTNPDDVARLLDGSKASMVFTDPPYGVGFQSGMSNGGTATRFKKIANDDVKLDIAPVIFASLEEDSAAFIWTSHQVYPEWRAQFSSHYKSTIIWHKPGGGIGDLKGDYATDYEMCLFCAKGRPIFRGKRGMAVWTVSKDGVNEYLHPTQKPVELARRAIEDFTDRGNAVMDLFVGSGSTLCAAEQSGRCGRGIELDPGYVAVTLERLSQMGLEPRLVDGTQ